MHKRVSEQLIKCVQHEQQQDIDITARLLAEFSLPKLVASGLAISNLQLENIRTALGGKIYIDLGPDPATGGQISRGGTGVGDIVKFYSTSNKKREEPLLEGVVFKAHDKQVVVAVDELSDQTADKLYACNKICLVKTTNAITYKRMLSTLRKLSEFNYTPDNPVIQYLLFQRAFLKQDGEACIDYANKELNPAQREAVCFALANEISIIHGPPGTGKTQTLVELTLQLFRQGRRILICGPSNVSVDNILERLSKIIDGTKLLRIGHPARILPATMAHSIELLSKTGDSGAIVRDIHQDINRKILEVRKLRSAKDKRSVWGEVKELRKELRRREHKVISELILASKVVVCTLHGSSSSVFNKVYETSPHLFDTLIIDEVSQSLEPQCWIPLISHLKSNISKLVIAGDNKQLPPTVKTENCDEVRRTLETTIFDKLEQRYGDDIKVFLNLQYRMNSKIMEFPSLRLYGGKLVAAPEVSERVLADLPGAESNDNTTVPLIWYDTQGDDFPESSDDLEPKAGVASSKFNENEAHLVLHYVLQLIDGNIQQESIGIIAPYNSQVSLLKRLVNEKYPGIEISTVDGFQGREKECIILSLVRNNEKFDVGFLKDERRLNVAITRPRRQLCVVGSMEMLERSQVPFLRSWAKWSEENSELRYPDISEIL